MTKIYKPNKCSECPVFSIQKGKIGTCLCMISSRKIFDSLEQMYKNCPLDWDK